MSGIDNVSDYTSKYNTNKDYSSFFSSMAGEKAENTFSLSDYASIRNGSYGKLLKQYYAKEEADKLSQKGDSSKQLVMLRSSADTLKRSASALTDSALWEKKKIKKKDEVTGKVTEVEDYDRDAIAKAVKAFAEAYNDVVEESGKSNTKGVLRNAVWMTGMVDKTQRLLAKAGITIGKGNKLEIDEETLKEADINTLKSLFAGQGSLADKVAQKANSISNAAVPVNGTYNRYGIRSNAFTELTAEVDKEV